MKAQLTPLGEVVGRYSVELGEITQVWESVGQSALVTGYTVPYAPAEDGCIVAPWDAWNRFVRDSSITSASGAAQGLSGKIYHPDLARTDSQCLETLAANRRQAGQLIGGEPHWYKANKIADLADLLELENGNVIVSAVGSSNVIFGQFVIPNPLEEIGRCRNFTADKAVHTRKGYMTWSVRISRTYGPTFPAKGSVLQFSMSG